MNRYRFTGSTPVVVPDLKRYEDDPIQPGEVVETELVINNSFFDLVESDAPPAPTPPIAAIPEPTPNPSTKESA